MFVSSGLNFKLRDDLHMNSAICGFESLFIEVKIQFLLLLLELSISHLILALYILTCTSMIYSEQFHRKGFFFIIMADFNIDLLTTDTNHQTADFIHHMFTHMCNNQ